MAIPAPGCTCPTPQLLMGVDFFRAFFPSPPFPHAAPLLWGRAAQDGHGGSRYFQPRVSPHPPKAPHLSQEGRLPRAPGFSEPFQLSCFSPPFMANFL